MSLYGEASIEGIPHRIAFLHPTLGSLSGLYGAQRSLLVTLEHLDRRYFSPQLILVSEGAFLTEAQAAGIPTTVMRWLAGITWRRPLRWARATLRFARWLSRNRIELLQLNLDCIDGGSIYLACRLAGTAFVYYNRVVPGPATLYNRWWLSNADYIISVSAASLTTLLRPPRPSHVFRLNSVPLSVIPSGRDIERLKRHSPTDGLASEMFNIPKEARVVGMVATIAPFKCQDIFIRTAALIRQACPEVVFVIVGEPFVWAEAYWHELQMLVAHLDLGAQVIFTGYRSDAPALMKRFDVLMHPSCREALGGVLIEAMALGIPVVASTADGIPELVRDGETGVLVASGNAADYARAVVKLLRNPDVASTMAARAKEWAQQFDGARVTRSMEECYRAVLSSRKRR